jgi:aryl sulfotransferase
MSGLTLLVSYPKSGNTWVRALLNAVCSGAGSVDINKLRTENIADREVLATLLGIATSDFLTKEEYRLRLQALEHAVRRTTGDLIFKVHEAMLPASVPPALPFPEGSIRAVVYIVRDPRDVAVSFAHHLGRTIDDTIRIMANSEYRLERQPRARRRHLPQLLSSWSNHVRSWTGRPGLNLQLVRYEDMHADPEGCFGRMMKFIGLAVPAPVLAGAIAASRFGALRAQEQQKGFVERYPRSKAFFRRGIAGGWRDSLSPEQAERIVAEHAPVMRQLGYLADAPAMIDLAPRIASSA